MFSRSSISTIRITLLLGLWVVAHVPGILFGTQDVPMHQTYVADEQRPVNGALHMLNERSIFGIRDKEEFWYGPIFAVITVPAVVADFTWQAVVHGVRSAQAYKDHVVFDWGGIMVGMRITVVLACAFSLYIVYRMFMLRTLNPTRRPLYAYMAAGLLGTNYFFFENSNLFMNWTFVVVLLIVQLYLGLLMYEDRGKRTLYWWLHGGVTVLNFGINYFNAMYLVAYLPLAWVLWRENAPGIRKRLYLYVAGVSAGLAFILWWNPYTFVRLLGKLGLGTYAAMMGAEYGSTYNPLTATVHSFGYYAQLIVLHHFPLLVAVLVAGYAVFRRAWREHFMWAWMFLSVAGAHYLVFGAIADNEERYILVTLVTLLLFSAAALVRYVSAPERDMQTVRVLGLLVLSTVVFHVVHIGAWLALYSEGPQEKQMIQEALALEAEGGSLVLVQDHIAGHVHTKRAYERFAEQKNATDINLYKAIFAAPLPDDVVPLDADYIEIQDFLDDPSSIDAYDYAIMYRQRCSLEINQATYIGANLLSLWYWDMCKPQYIRLK